MKAIKCLMQRVQLIIALCFAIMILPLPLRAQETKLAARRYCPYCGLVDLRAGKFCGACGARLPNRMATRLSPTALQQHDSLNLIQDWIEPSYRPPCSMEESMAAGLLAGTIGLFGGALVGYEIDKTTSDYDGEWDGFYGFLIGAPIGESLLLPVGVHLANGRRGNLPLAMLASVGIAGAGIAVAASAEDANILVAIPIAQLLACTAIERSTSRNGE